MTRAKRALYMISDFSRVSKRSSVHYLRQCLGDEADENGRLWSTGDPDWHQTFTARAPEPAHEAVAANRPQFAPAHPRLQLQRPSGDKHSRLKASLLLDLNAKAAEFGTQVHDAFEQIEWLDSQSGEWPPKGSHLRMSAPFGVPHSPEQQVNRATGEGAEQVKATRDDQAHPSPVPTPADNPLLKNCFANPEIKALFTKPEAPIELWREKAFSYVEDDQFINGVFDRVHLHKDESGKIIKAAIIDFKTDRIHEDNTVEQAVEKHRPQLEVYAKALNKITGLHIQSIHLKLLFTDVSKLRSC
jgi:ATP-dependent exoDNAse (exonuclease V) beta subunit